jgi:hypothetical protein
MDRDQQLILTALTLLLAKQIQTEAAAAGFDKDDIAAQVEARDMIERERIPVTGLFGVRHF